jgi:hypothetical protein
MQRYERSAEERALKTDLDNFFHEIEKNEKTIAEGEISISPDRDLVIQAAKDRIAHWQERINEVLGKQDRLREHSGEYADLGYGDEDDDEDDEA